jgi:hypothetical protein
LLRSPACPASLGRQGVFATLLRCACRPSEAGQASRRPAEYTFGVA